MRQATASVARDSPKRVIKKSGATAVVASESPRSASSTSAAVGRHGRSKLSERVVTVADETSHDEAEMEQEDYPEDTAQPQDDEEEEDEGSAQKAAASGERYVAFSESKHPDWSYPLLPGELGYVAPVAKSSPAVRSSGGLASRTASVTTGTAARKGKARAPIQFLTDDNASMEGPAADEPEDDVSRDMVSAEQDEEEEDVGYNGDMDHNTAPDEFEEHNDQEVEDAIEEEEVNQPDEGTQENEEVVEVVEAKKGRGRPPTSKKRDRDSTEKSTVRASKKPKKEEGALVVAENNGSRGKRIRLEPVDFWKGEQVKYNMRRDSLGSGTLVPVATAVLKAPPSEEHETKPVHRKKSLSKGALPIKKEKVPVLKTPDLPVLNFETGEEVTERVVLTEEMYNPQVVGQGSTFMFQRTFSVGSFCGSGIMILPKGSEKPKKSSGPTVLIVYVISGKVRVTLHKSSFEVTEGSQFMIPRGNFYSMKNTGSSDVRLFFLQAKESEMTEQAQAAAPSEPPKAPIDPKDADSDDTAKPKKSRSSKAASDAPATKKAGTSTDVPKTKKSDKDAKESSEGISSKAKGKQRAKK
ncbi:Mif2/CENP-C like-domain-containing protein [Obelidium mucronatum]|nr:Mif2/CENP-C like-domain-containing protein [Obelidium mucronatum]